MKGKKLRQLVHDMYDGHCAYTGKPLDDKWQIDHATPKCHPIWFQHPDTIAEWGINYSCNDAENLLPALSIVNHYKRALDVEQFRRYLMQFHIRLAKLPKKTKAPRTERRKEYMYQIANAFEISIDRPFCGIFYFEKHLTETK